jgi:hypothetical protein
MAQSYMKRSQEWHLIPSIQDRYRRRLNDMSHIYTSYKNCDKIHHGRLIVIKDIKDWNSLFCHEEKFNSYLSIYRKSIYGLTLCECKVTLLLEHNYRPSIHLAIFIIHKNPHQQFHDGHAVQIEFGDKSQTHQNIERLFDLRKPTTRVVQMSEYDMLRFMANDDNYADLLYGCFSHNFKPIRFSHISQGYFVDEFADNDHEEHDCCHIQIPITDYYAELNLQDQQSEPNISSYWNMNLNCLENQKN